jgi:transketolase
MRDHFIKELTKQAQLNPSILLITGDLGFGVFDDFRRLLPNQFINAGVAEQNMTAMACGLAMEGHKVFTYSIGNFPTLRCLEQIRNNICYHNADVTIVSIGGGFSYGQLGISHFATEDLSIMRAIPNIVVLTPSSNDQVVEMVRAISSMQGPKYLRLDKDFGPDVLETPSFMLGKINRLIDGTDATIICVGGIVNEALKAANILGQRGISLRVLSVGTLKPLEIKEIILAAEQTKIVITLEENSIFGGLAGAVSETCMNQSVFPKKFQAFGIPDIFPEIVGDQKYLRKYFKLDAESIVKKIIELQ